MLNPTHIFKCWTSKSLILYPLLDKQAQFLLHEWLWSLSTSWNMRNSMLQITSFMKFLLPGWNGTVDEHLLYAKQFHVSLNLLLNSLQIFIVILLEEVLSLILNITTFLTVFCMYLFMFVSKMDNRLISLFLFKSLAVLIKSTC
jgi:hypothetical protein